MFSRYGNDDRFDPYLRMGTPWRRTYTLALARVGAMARRSDPGALYLHRPREMFEWSKNPSNPALVSYPRTGSHWLRNVAEPYYERPQLPRSFVYFDRRDFLWFHTHDRELNHRFHSVVYMYRDAVDTLYSQMNFAGQDLDDVGRVLQFARAYGAHLAHWLVTEEFTTHKTVATYEEFRADPAAVFEKISQHLALPHDPPRLSEIMEAQSQDRMKETLTYNERVVSSGNDDYREGRSRFRERHGPQIYAAVRSAHPGLEPHVDRMTASS